MNQEHPNIEVLKRFDPTNLADASEFIAADAVFHFFNPSLPDLQGDYVGPDGIQSFFQRMGRLTKGTFQVEPVSATPVGDELVVVQTKNTLVLEDRQIETDVVVVWRVVEGMITEVWDIPSVYTATERNLDAN